MTGSVDGYSVLPATQFAWTHLCMGIKRDLSVGGSFSLREMPEFDVKPHLLAPLLILSQCYLVKSFQPGRTSARQQRFKFGYFVLIGAKGHRTSPACLPALPLATRSHQVVFAYNQVIRPHGSYHPSGALPRESVKPTTGLFACNCKVPKAYTTEASG